MDSQNFCWFEYFIFFLLVGFWTVSVFELPKCLVWTGVVTHMELKSSRETINNIKHKTHWKVKGNLTRMRLKPRGWLELRWCFAQPAARPAPSYPIPFYKEIYRSYQDMVPFKVMHEPFWWWLIVSHSFFVSVVGPFLFLNCGIYLDFRIS